MRGPPDVTSRFAISSAAGAAPGAPPGAGTAQDASTGIALIAANPFNAWRRVIFVDISIGFPPC